MQVQTELRPTHLKITSTVALVIELQGFNEDEPLINGFDYGYVYLVSGNEYSVLDTFEVRGTWVNGNIYQIICYFDDDLEYLENFEGRSLSTGANESFSFTKDIEGVLASKDLKVMANLDYESYDDKPDVDYIKNIKSTELKRVGSPHDMKGTPVIIDASL